MEAEGSNIKWDRGSREGHGLQKIRRIRRWLRGATLLILSITALSTCDKFDFFGELESARQVTEAEPLSLNPELVVVSLNNVVNLQASGGVSPYSYDIFTGSGSVNSATGVYTAPGAASNDVVRVTDSEGTTDLSVIRALSPLKITPGSASLAVGDVKTFTGSGGEDTQDYTFTIVSGPGTITSAGPDTAEYEPDAAGDAVIQVEDALGSVKQANVTVTPPGELRIDPTEETVVVLGTVNFTAFDGDDTPPHNFFKDSGSGTLTPLGPSTASYEAPASAEMAVIRVTDNEAPTPNEVTATVFVVAAGPVAISPSAVTIKEGESFTFNASGGLAPYTFDMKSGKGTVDPVTGFYTAVKKSKDKVRVTDSLGDDDTATVNVKKN